MTPTDHSAKDARRSWMRPKLDRLRTVEAEIAPRTTAADGAFSKTS